MTLLNDRYRIIRPLSTGGFGETFLAEDTQMPSLRRCVIKQLKPIINKPQLYQLIQERFQREAVILENLGEHSNQIPKLYAYFTTTTRQFYLVQEWIEGQTLRQNLETSGHLGESCVREILVNLLPVLDYVHSQRIIHRDIKPDNIILRQRDNKPVLIDFGAVKETMATIYTESGNPASSIVIGTPGFMPSEQAAGRPVYSSDLYSLGLTAIYLLTGKMPQELETDSSTGEIIWQRYALSVSPSLAAVLDKAIQSHMRDRYPTALTMLQALQFAAPIKSTVIPSSQPPVVSAPPTETSPQPFHLPPPPSAQGSGQKAVLAGSLITGGLIGASVIIGLLLTKSPQPITEKTTSSVTPQPTPAVLSTPSTSPVAPYRQASLTQTNDYAWLSYKTVTDTDLAGKNAFELDVLRNSIYARHGRQFRNQALQSYFNNQPWYRPVYTPDEFPDSLLSPIEKNNVVSILQYQDSHDLRWAR